MENKELLTMEKGCGKMCRANLQVYVKQLKEIFSSEQMEMQVGQTLGMNVYLCVCVCVPGTVASAMLSCVVLRCRVLFELGQGRAEGRHKQGWIFKIGMELETVFFLPIVKSSI